MKKTFYNLWARLDCSLNRVQTVYFHNKSGLNCILIINSRRKKQMTFCGQNIGRKRVDQTSYISFFYVTCSDSCNIKDVK